MIRLILLLLISVSVFADDMGKPAQYHWKHQGDFSIKLIHGESDGARMYQRKVPGGLDAMCFDTVMISRPGNQMIGDAIDCISNVEDNDGVITVIGTTFFNFPQGTIVARGNLTLTPVGQKTETAAGMMVTHITGGGSKGNRSIIEGTGIYEGAKGNVRLSGFLNMSKFKGNQGDPVGFSCLFEINNIKLAKRLIKNTESYELFQR